MHCLHWLVHHTIVHFFSIPSALKLQQKILVCLLIWVLGDQLLFPQRTALQTPCPFQHQSPQLHCLCITPISSWCLNLFILNSQHFTHSWLVHHWPFLTTWAASASTETWSFFLCFHCCLSWVPSSWRPHLGAFIVEKSPPLTPTLLQ